MAIDREDFKNYLISNGVDWDENQIDNYIALKESGENLAVEMQKRTPLSAEFNQPQSLAESLHNFPQTRE